MAYQHGVGFYLDRSFTLTDDERIAMIKVLLSSRALHREEMLPIIDKLIKQSSEPKRLETMVKSLLIWVCLNVWICSNVSN